MGGLDVRHQRDVHVHYILRARFKNELPDCFQKWQPLDVTSCSTDFGDDNVIFALVGEFANAVLDHIGDVRNYLHGFAEIITSPLL